MADLRKLISDDLGVDIEDDLLSNDRIQNQWDRAVNYWWKYMARPEKNLGIVIDSSLIYTFTNPIPYSIVTLYKLPSGDVVSCSDFYYSIPILTVSVASQYSVVYRGDLDITVTDEEDIPIKLRDLFVNYSKRVVGQFLKFSNYNEKPFDIDANGWYSEAQSAITELENFIKINRDERVENISNLTNR